MALLVGGLLPALSLAASINGVYQTDNAIYDYRLIDEKSTSKQSKDSHSIFSTIQSTPVNTSKVSRFLIPPLVSATATSKSTVKEDYIEAKVRAYNDQGGLYGTKTDSATRSEYAGATYETGIKWISFAYGNHVHKLSGYKDVYHETYTG